MNKKELMKLTKAELLELAKTNGRYVEESMSKAQIVEILVGSDESADQQPAEQSANEQAEEQHSADEMPSDETPSEQNPAEEHADESAPEENPSEQNPADEHSDETPSDDNPAKEQGDNAPGENPASETPSDENSSEEHPAEQSVLRKKIAIAEELRRRQSRVGSGITKFAGSMQQVMKQEIANRAMKYGGVKSKILSSNDRKEALRKERDLRASRNK